MRFVTSALLALALVGCAHENSALVPTTVAMAPMPKRPDFEGDGFRLEVSRGCANKAACDSLRERAYERLSRCTQQWTAYVRVAKSRGYVFTPSAPTCPIHVRQDVANVKILCSAFVTPNTRASSWIAYR